MLERSGIQSAFNDVIIEQVDGGHDHHGNEQVPLDLEALEHVLLARRSKVRAVAVAAPFAVRNPAHEQQVRDLVTSTTDLPVTISSELSESLDAPRRALTAVLNARLLSRIADLVSAVGRSLAELDITAPVTIAKGDGSLAVAEAVAQRPIETILSSPAASMIGAGVLSGRTDFLLSDIGGTTTDVGQSLEGRPRLAPHGAMVGGWRTMVRAIDVRTTGLGGDSEVTSELDQVAVGPRRAVPLALLGVEHASVVERLRAERSDPGPRELAARFVLRPLGAPDPAMDFSTIEQRVLDRVGTDPVPVADATTGSVERKALHGLAERGIVQLAGFTPSDAAHVLGLQDNWSSKTALAAAEVMAWYTGLAVEQFCERVWSETVRRSALAVLEVAVGDSFLGAGADPVISAAVDGLGQLGRTQVAISPSDPVVAVGGPAGVYYREVARRLSAELILPEQFAVANAVGAAAGFLAAHGTTEVHSDGPGMFRVVTHDGVETATDATSALALAHERAEEIARSELDLLARGLPAVGEVGLRTEVERHDAPESVADEGLYFARVFTEARARPFVLDATVTP
jgi:N-methylhydantoinase A/oxoprolinase/acetone carboxylase beta subunit